MSKHSLIRVSLSAIALSGLLLLAPGRVCADGFDQAHLAWAKFLSTYVTTTAGIATVRYSELKAHPELLASYLSELAKVSRVEFDRWNPADKSAFLINAYNAGAIKLVIDRYPIKSFSELEGFLHLSSPFKTKAVTTLGEERSLAELQEELLEMNGGDLHYVFALACPARGCPALRYEPYTGAWVKQQIQGATKEFFRNPTNAKWDPSNRALAVSSILESCWFSVASHCFGAQAKKKHGSVGKFVAPLLDLKPEEQKLVQSDQVTVTFLPLSWTLNETAKP